MTKRKTKPSALAVGRTYYGPGNRRLTVTAIKGNEVLVTRPVSLTQERMSLADMRAFAAASPLRTYHHKSGEVRTKLREDAEEVFYGTPGHEFHAVPKAEWAKWRKAAT